jgi:uncharacterized membrane protein
MTAGERLLSAALLLLVVVSGCSRRPAYPEPPLTADAVIIAVSDLRTDLPRFFTYRQEGGEVNFFVVRTGGEVLTFLDACGRCYSKKLGYACEKGAVYCRACNERYPIEALAKGFGSCKPIRLESEIRDGKLYIRREKLREMMGKY